MVTKMILDGQDGCQIERFGFGLSFGWVTIIWMDLRLVPHKKIHFNQGQTVWGGTCRYEMQQS